MKDQLAFHEAAKSFEDPVSLARTIDKRLRERGQTAAQTAETHVAPGVSLVTVPVLI